MVRTLRRCLGFPGHAPAPAFVRVDTGEPHARRRVEILKELPEIRALYGYDLRTAGVTLVVVVAQLSLASWVGTWAGGGWAAALGVVALAFFVGAILNHWTAMSIHECSHNLAAPTARANIAVSLLANVPMVLPCAMTFRRYHLEHHTLLGVDDGDTDLPHALEVRWIANRTWAKALWWTFNLPVYIWRGTTFVKGVSRGEVLNLLGMVVVDAALLGTIGPGGLGYLALSTFFGHGLHPVAFHFIHEHYTFRAGQETYSYYGPLNRVTFNVGYHNEHHDFMNVPGWRLPALHRQAAHHYAGLLSHRSWTWAMLTFVLDPRLGYGSRIVRSRRAWREGRRAPSGAPASSPVPAG